jgi:two-component system sensor histidine kinase DesK
VRPMSRTTSAPEVLGWSRKSDPERLEALTRWSLYLMLTLAPWMVVVILANVEERTASGWALLALSVAHAVLAAVATSSALEKALGRREVGAWSFAALGVLTGAILALALSSFPGVGNPEDTTVVVHVVLAVSLAAFAPMIEWRGLVLASFALALVWFVVARLAGVWDAPPAALLITVVILLFVAASVRSSVWMIRVSWDQERRRELDARLAAAEERLRFSRDLHDTFGRTLSTVAVKAELAAELASRGKDGAVEEMREVRRVAEEALKEMRELVAGIRSPELSVELEGARSLLGSAGVSVSVTTDEVELPRATQEALAWVVREAVTNVVRHSHASRCLIDLRVADGEAVLRIENDGAREAGRAGSGLLGLSERLERVSGSLGTAREHAEFRLEARVPLEEVPT